MAENTFSYKCPACGGALRYTPEGFLQCDHCGNTFNVEAIEKLSAVEESKGFDWGDYKERFQDGAEQLDNTTVYICRSCGAQVEVESTTVATHCPYCDNEIVITDRISGGIKPNVIIPFAIDKKKAIECVRKHFKGKRLLPSDFTKTHSLNKLTGVYVPFWLFDAGVEGTITYEAEKVTHRSDSKYDYTDTAHYLVEVGGSVQYEKLPIDGSIKMDDGYMKAIEPFDYKDLCDFNPAYLSGYMADRFDENPDDSSVKAGSKMGECTEKMYTASFSGSYTSVTTKSKKLFMVSPTVKYALFPVYTLNLAYGGKNYMFAVNGQTGKVAGSLPISKKKRILYFILSFLAGFAVTALLTFLLTMGG